MREERWFSLAFHCCLHCFLSVWHHVARPALRIPVSRVGPGLVGSMAYIIWETTLKKKKYKVTNTNWGQGVRRAVVRQFRGTPGKGDYIRKEGRRICDDYVSAFFAPIKDCSSWPRVCYCLGQSLQIWKTPSYLCEVSASLVWQTGERAIPWAGLGLEEQPGLCYPPGWELPGGPLSHEGEEEEQAKPWNVSHAWGLTPLFVLNTWPHTSSIWSRAGTSDSLSEFLSLGNIRIKTFQESWSGPN